MDVLFEVYDGDRKVAEHTRIWKLRHTGLWEFELLLKVSGLRQVVRCPDLAFESPLDQQPPFDHATDDFAYSWRKSSSQDGADSASQQLLSEERGQRPVQIIAGGRASESLLYPFHYVLMAASGTGRTRGSQSDRIVGGLW